MNAPYARPQCFDERCIPWQPLGDFPHFQFHILQVDMEQRIADVLFRFAAGQQIVLHRHKALNHTFVVAGEHLIYNRWHAPGSPPRRHLHHHPGA